MTEKVTIGYNEWIITTFTHEQKIISVPYVSYFFFKTIQLKCEHTFRIVQNIFLQFSVYDIFFLIEGLNQQVIDCVSRFH